MTTIDDVIKSQGFVEHKFNRAYATHSEFLEVLKENKVAYYFVSESDGNKSSNSIYVPLAQLDAVARLYAELNKRSEERARKLIEDPVQVIWSPE